MVDFWPVRYVGNRSRERYLFPWIKGPFVDETDPWVIVQYISLLACWL